jgi:hypothetical protein
LVHAPEFAQGGAASFLGRHSGSDVLRDLPLEVEPQLLVELVVDRAAAD